MTNFGRLTSAVGLVSLFVLGETGCSSLNFGVDPKSRLSRQIGVALYDASFDADGHPTNIRVSSVSFGPSLDSSEWNPVTDSSFSMPDPTNLRRGFFQKCHDITTLRSIELQGCKFNNKDLALLPDNISVVNVAGPNIDDGFLDVVSKMPSLETLYLRATSITDAGLSRFTPHKLTKIDICGTQIGDAGLESLASITSLEQIIVRDTLITEAGILKYKEAGGKAQVSQGNIHGFRI